MTGERDSSSRTGDDLSLEVFAGYHVHEELGRGGMAMVHRAELVGPGGASKEVALKRILPGPQVLSGDDEAAKLAQIFVERFLAEMTIAAKLSHPNIVHVLNFGEYEDTHYIVLELVRGMDLRVLMKELRRLARGEQEVHYRADKQGREVFERYRTSLAQRVLPQHLAAFIALEVAEGLAYAHQYTVHRDLSADNLMLSVAGEVKINDWGIAKAKRAGAKVVTQTNRAYGKLAYMAPEQFRGKALDGRADLYALGILLFRLLSGGRHPYDNPAAAANDDMGRVFRAAMRERGPIAEMLPDAPPEVHDLLERLIEPDIDKRPANAAELLRPLKALTGDVYDARNELRQLVRLVYYAAPKTIRDPKPLGQQQPSPSNPGSEPHSVSHIATKPEGKSAENRGPEAGSRPEQAREPIARTVPLPLAEGLPGETPAELSTPETAAANPRTRRLWLAIGALSLVAVGLVAFAVGFFGFDRSGSSSADGHAAHEPTIARVEHAAAPTKAREAAGVASVSPGASDLGVDSTPREQGAGPSESDEAAERAGATARQEPNDPQAGDPPPEATPAASGRLQVFVLPFGRLSLDGRPIRERRVYTLEPGTYRVVAVYGTRRESRSVRVEAGELERVTFRFVGE